MRLTKAQRRVLEVMVRYGCRADCIYGRGRGPTRAFFAEPAPYGKHQVRWQTLHALEDKGLIRDATGPEWRWHSSEFELTEAERAAAENMGEADDGKGD